MLLVVLDDGGVDVDVEVDDEDDDDEAFGPPRRARTFSLRTSSALRLRGCSMATKANSCAR